jgi:hypothetical protein
LALKIVAVDQVQLRVQGLAEVQPYQELLRAELGGEPAKAFLIGVGRGADLQLLAELLGCDANEAIHLFVAQALAVFQEAQRSPKLFLRKSVASRRSDGNNVPLRRGSSPSGRRGSANHGG